MKGENMSKALRFGITVTILAGLIAGCKQDPNVRKQAYLESGQQYYAQGKYQDAVIQFRNAVQIDQRFAQAHYELGRCYLKLEIWNSAYNSLLRAVELDPSNLPAQMELAKIFVRGQEYMRAREKADLLLKQNPKDIEATVIKAQSLAGVKDTDAAI